MPGHIMVRAGHPANSKRGSICICYKNCLSLKVVDIRLPRESIAFDLQIGDRQFLMIVTMV